MSQSEEASVHSTSKTKRSSTAKSATFGINEIELFSDEETVESQHPVHPPQGSTSRLPPPGRLHAPTPAGSLRIPSNVNHITAPRRERGRAWEEDAMSFSRGRGGTTIRPQDPTAKKATLPPSRPAYGQRFYGEHADEQAAALRKKAPASAPGPNRVFQMAMTDSTQNEKGKQAQPKPKAKPRQSNGSELAGMPRISRISPEQSREVNPRPSVLPEAGSSRAPPVSHSAQFAIEIKVKGNAPRAAQETAKPKKKDVKGKGRPSEVIEISSDEAAAEEEQDDDIEDFDDPPTATPAQGGRRKSHAGRLQQDSADGGHSSPDPLSMQQPFDLTSKRRSNSAAEARRLAKPGIVQDQVDKLEKEKKPRLSDKLRGKGQHSAQKPPESTRQRGFGDDENEMDLQPAPAHKASRPASSSKASTEFPIISFPVHPYSFASGHAPSSINSQHHLVYNAGGDLNAHRIAICRGQVSSPIFTFTRSDCEGVGRSAEPNGDEAFLVFRIRDGADVMKHIGRDCGFHLSDLDNSQATELVVTFPHGEDDEARRRLWAFIIQWTKKEPKVADLNVSPTAEPAYLDGHREALTRAARSRAGDQPSTAASGSAKRVPKKAQQQQVSRDGLQQSKLELGSPAAGALAVRRSSRPSTSVYAAPPPPPSEEAPVDPIPSEKVVLVYPVGQTSSVVSITHGDTKRLLDSEFLNDTLIEFGLKRIQLKLEEKDRATEDLSQRIAESVYMFNSFFYKKLSQRSKAGSKNDWDGYAAVKKWTAKVNLFGKKFIIVPINEHLHWYLAVIINPEAILHHVIDPDAVPSTATTRSTRQKAQTSSETPSAAATPPADLVVDGTTSRHFQRKPEYAPETVQQREEAEEAQREAQLASQMSAEAAQTETGADIDESGDVTMVDREVLDGEEPGNVTMEDATGAIPSTVQLHSPSHRSTVGSNGEESSSDDDAASDTVEANLVGTPSSTQPPSAALRRRPSTPPKARVATAIAPSRVAPGDPPASAQPSVIVDDDEHQPKAAANVPSAHDPIETCYIYTFDSLEGKHAAVIRHLTRYLCYEARDKKQLMLDEEVVKRAIASKNVEVPLQDNFSDCGLYLLHYVEQLLSNPEKMLQHIAEVPPSFSKMPPEMRNHWKATVDVKWDGAAAAGKRKVLREEVKVLREEWAKYREPLDAAEQKAREERQLKKKQAKEAEEARKEEEDARAAAELAQKRELEGERKSSVVIEDEWEQDSSMVVEEPAPVEPPSPAASSASTRSKKGKGGKKGRSKAPAKGPGGSRKRALETVTLGSSDEDEDEEPPRPTVGSNSNGAAPLPHHAPQEVAVAPSKSKSASRSATTSTFINPRTTPPGDSPPVQDQTPTEGDLPSPRPPPSPPPAPTAAVIAPTEHDRPPVDVDPSGDLGSATPEQEQQDRSDEQVVVNALSEPDSPPRKRKRHSAASVPARSPAPFTLPLPASVSRSRNISEASWIANATVSAPGQGTHTRFDRDGQQASSSRAGDILVNGSDEDPASPAQAAPRPPASPSRAMTGFAVEVVVARASTSRHSRQQQQQQGLPLESSPLELSDPKERRRESRTSKGAPMEEMTIDDD